MRERHYRPEPAGEEGDKALLEEILRRVGGFHDPDEDIAATAARLIDTWRELGRGVRIGPPELKWFPSGYHSLLVKGPIETSFLCPHHMLPVAAKVVIAVVPNESGQVMGISKFIRVVRWASARFALQEAITSLIADTLWDCPDGFRPKAIWVGIRGEHFCEKIRGVRQSAPVITSEKRGCFEETEIERLWKIVLV